MEALAAVVLVEALARVEDTEVVMALEGLEAVEVVEGLASVASDLALDRVEGPVATAPAMVDREAVRMVLAAVAVQEVLAMAMAMGDAVDPAASPLEGGPWIWGHQLEDIPSRAKAESWILSALVEEGPTALEVDQVEPMAMDLVEDMDQVESMAMDLVVLVAMDPVDVDMEMDLDPMAAVVWAVWAWAMALVEGVARVRARVSFIQCKIDDCPIFSNYLTMWISIVRLDDQSGIKVGWFSSSRLGHVRCWLETAQAKEKATCQSKSSRGRPPKTSCKEQRERT